MKAFIFLLVALPQLIVAQSPGEVLAQQLEDAGLTTLLSLIGKANLVDTLVSVEPFTVFAPTNEAFDRLKKEKPDVFNAVLSDNDLLTKVLTYHVIPNAAIKSNQLAEDNKVNTANGAPIRVNVYKGHHSYQTKVTANGKRVTAPDVMIGQGSVAHVVDEVIIPIEKTDNIPAVLQKDGRFSKLLAAVGIAELGEALSNEDGTFTVFAPTDAAFEKLGSALDSVLAQKDVLTGILLKHVAPKVIFSKGIGWNYLDTLNENEKLKTQVYHGGVVIVKSKSGYARVVDPDLVATNGVIHAIDTVI